MYFVDTNVWLEVLLDQENSDAASAFLRRMEGPNLAISDFSVFSIGILLFREKQEAVFKIFLGDLEETRVAILRLELQDLMKVEEAAASHKLDFDDAYQYVLAVKHGLRIVSFDKDFDRVPHGRKIPQDC